MADPKIFEDAPEADVLEQLSEVTEAEEETVERVPLEANEADVSEQRREVRLDEDEYR